MSIRNLALRAAARSGNALYAAASAARRAKLRERAARHPEAYAPPPEIIEAQARRRIPHSLQHVVKNLTGVTPPLLKIMQLVEEGLASGLFSNFGEVIYINPHRIKGLIAKILAFEELAGKTIGEERFIEEASRRGLLRQHAHANQIEGALVADYPQPERGNYMRRPYSVPTRDGRKLEVVRTIHQDRVTTGDDNPSILCLNGLACRNETFDLNPRESFALELADHGGWIYQAESRGIGRNRSQFDPNCFVDTVVSNDYPAIAEFVCNRPHPRKPVVIIGHSMGGMAAEFMLIRQAYKLNRLLEQLAARTGLPPMTTIGRTRRQIEDYLSQLLIVNSSNEETAALAAEARGHLEILKSVKGVIALGSPKIFDKNSHPIFPAVLMLNILLPLLGEDRVPFGLGREAIRHLPSLANVVRMLVNPENFADPTAFMNEFITKGVDSFSLGMGLQFLKEIYAGRGFRRMGKTKFNYAAHLNLIPVDIPLFQVFGSEDPLAPPLNLAFIDHGFYSGGTLDFSPFPHYSHRTQRIYRLSRTDDPGRIPLEVSVNQVVGFEVAGINHMDFLYGKTANRVVRPLVHRLVEIIGQV